MTRRSHACGQTVMMTRGVKKRSEQLEIYMLWINKASLIALCKPQRPKR